MDRERFDALVRLFAARQSRRTTIATLLGAALLGSAPESEAKSDKGKNRAKGRDKGKGRGDGKQRNGNTNRQNNNKNGNTGRDANPTTPTTEEDPPVDPAPVDEGIVTAEATCGSPGPSSNLNTCNFNYQDMTGANLSSSSMRETKFRGTNLCGANLSSSQLKDADLRGFPAGNVTNLTKANLSSSGCSGTLFNDRTVLCQTRTCNGTISNRDCPDGAAICCDVSECEDLVCQTRQCQDSTCVYGEQVNNEPGNLCEEPRVCCDAECCAEGQTCCGGDCIDEDACCTNGEEGCGNGEECVEAECVDTCACPEQGCFRVEFGSSGSGNGAFDDPSDVAVSPTTGRVYVADTNNHRIQYFDANGDYIGQWAVPGLGEDCVSPHGVAVSPNGNRVYVAEACVDRIFIHDANGTPLNDFGGHGDGNGELDTPFGVAVAPNGNVYVTDAANFRIQYFDADGGYIGKWGEAGDGPGQFGFRNKVAVAPNGDVYVSDRDNFRIQQFTATGGFIRQGGAFDDPDDPGFTSGLAGITVRSDGVVFTTDALFEVEVYSATLNLIGLWGDLDPGEEQGLFRPQGIAIGPDGLAYVAHGLNTIKVFCVNPTG